jgi:hypothetical protein
MSRILQVWFFDFHISQFMFLLFYLHIISLILGSDVGGHLASSVEDTNGAIQIHTLEKKNMATAVGI